MTLDLVKELTALADKGWAVNLIYDDDGNWAFSSEGAQNCRELPDGELSISHWVKGSAFRPSIEEAWSAFLEENKDEF